MTALKLALRRGAPRRIEIRWGWRFRDLEVRFDGARLQPGAQQSLQSGQTYALRDGSTLAVRLSRTWLGPELEILRDGEPVPESPTDPYSRLKGAYGAVFVVAVLTLLVGLVSAWRAPHDPTGLVYGGLFLALGFLVRGGALLALWTAVLLFPLDGVLALARGNLTIPAALVKFFLTAYMARGLAALIRLHAQRRFDSSQNATQVWGARAAALLAALLLLGGLPRGAAYSPSEVFARAAPTVVVVTTAMDGDMRGQGSGVVIDRERVVTNQHVVRQGNEWTVRHKGKSHKAHPLRISVEHDLVELAVPGLQAEPAEIRNGQPIVGDRVFAVGAPQGLELTLSEGLVSGLRREGGESEAYVQTSAAISPGSSGGGLFDDRGRLIGITTFQFKGGQNLNFAVPATWIGLLRREGEKPPADTPPQAPGQRAAREPDAMPSPATVCAWLRDRWDLEQETLVRSLGEMGGHAEMALVECQGHPEGEIRARAAEVLGRLAESGIFNRAGVAQHLSGRLSREPSAKVQLQLVMALNRLGPEGLEGLARLDSSPQASLRSTAAEALAKLDASSAVPQLLRLLDDSEDSVRQVAAAALRSKGQLAHGEILSALEQRSGWCPTKPAAAMALTEIVSQIGPAGRAARPSLQKLSACGGELAQAATRALILLESQSQ